MRKNITSLKWLILSICLSLSLSAQEKESVDPVKDLAEKKQISAEEAKMLKQLGVMAVANYLVQLQLNEEEKELFMQGAMGARDAKELDPEIRKNWAAIRKYYNDKVNAAKMAKLANIKVPMDQEIETSSGEKTSLAELVKGKKAILLDFWATWCGPCMAMMPELIKKAETLNPQGIVVAGMNTENKAKAEKIRTSKSISFTWLVEPNRVFSKLLSINSIPRMVLISPEGKVLFNGHPNDAALKTAISKIGAKL